MVHHNKPSYRLKQGRAFPKGRSFVYLLQRGEVLSLVSLRVLPRQDMATLSPPDTTEILRYAQDDRKRAEVTSIDAHDRHGNLRMRSPRGVYPEEIYRRRARDDNVFIFVSPSPRPYPSPLIPMGVNPHWMLAHPSSRRERENGLLRGAAPLLNSPIR
jgi:hypothetical protein